MQIYGDDSQCYTVGIYLTRLYVRVKVVAVMKQPMEADVSGGTAEAVFLRAKDPVIFLLETEMGSADLADLIIHLFVYLLLEYLVNTLQKINT